MVDSLIVVDVLLGFFFWGGGGGGGGGGQEEETRPEREQRVCIEYVHRATISTIDTSLNLPASI